MISFVAAPNRSTPQTPALSYRAPRMRTPATTTDLDLMQRGAVPRFGDTAPVLTTACVRWSSQFLFRPLCTASLRGAARSTPPTRARRAADGGASVPTRRNRR